MKNLKIHLAWGLVVFVLSVALIRALTRGPQPEDRGAEKQLRDEIARHASTISDLEQQFARATAQRDTSSALTSEEPGEPTVGAAEEPGRARSGPQSEGERLTAEQIRSLLRSGSRGDRTRALRAIGSLENREEKVSLLREALASGDVGTRMRALGMLKDIGGTESVDLALGVLQGDGPSWLKGRAAATLGGLGGPESVGALLEAYRSEDLRTRTGAALALNRLGQPGPIQEMIPAATAMLDHPDGAVREDGVELLGKLGTLSVLAPLGRALQDPNSRVRREAVSALGRTRLTEAVPLLEQALSDPSPSVSGGAKRAIENIQNPDRERERSR